MITDHLVPEAGIEPARTCIHWCLRPTRLPIPPFGLFRLQRYKYFSQPQARHKSRFFHNHTKSFYTKSFKTLLFRNKTQEI